MSTHALLLSGALVLSAGFCLGPVRARAEEKPKAAEERPKAAVADLSGRWAYNTDLSDDAQEKMREAMDRRGFGGGRMGGGIRGPMMGGGMGSPPDAGDDPREAMQPIFEPAEEMTISQAPSEIVMDELYGSRRTLHPNGKKLKTDNGRAEIKSEWKDGKLQVETRSGWGRKIAETWELSATGSRLTAVYKIDGPMGPLTLKRVYDREPAAAK